MKQTMKRDQVHSFNDKQATWRKDGEIVQNRTHKVKWNYILTFFDIFEIKKWTSQVFIVKPTSSTAFSLPVVQLPE